MKLWCCLTFLFLLVDASRAFTTPLRPYAYAGSRIQQKQSTFQTLPTASKGKSITRASKQTPVILVTNNSPLFGKQKDCESHNSDHVSVSSKWKRILQQLKRAILVAVAALTFATTVAAVAPSAAHAAPPTPTTEYHRTMPSSSSSSSSARLASLTPAQRKQLARQKLQQLSPEQRQRLLQKKQQQQQQHLQNQQQLEQQQQQQQQQRYYQQQYQNYNRQGTPQSSPSVTNHKMITKGIVTLMMGTVKLSVLGILIAGAIMVGSEDAAAKLRQKLQSVFNGVWKQPEPKTFKFPPIASRDMDGNTVVEEQDTTEIPTVGGGNRFDMRSTATPPPPTRTTTTRSAPTTTQPYPSSQSAPPPPKRHTNRFDMRSPNFYSTGSGSITRESSSPPPQLQPQRQQQPHQPQQGLKDFQTQYPIDSSPIYSSGELDDHDIRDRHIDPRLEHYYQRAKDDKVTQKRKDVMLRNSKDLYDAPSPTNFKINNLKPEAMLGLRRRTDKPSINLNTDWSPTELSQKDAHPNNGFHMLYQNENPTANPFANNPAIRTGADDSSQNRASRYMLWKGLAHATRKQDKRAITYVSASNGSHDVDDLMIHKGAAYLPNGQPVYSRPQDNVMPTINTGADPSSQKFALNYMMQRFMSRLTGGGINKSKFSTYHEDVTYLPAPSHRDMLPENL